MKQNLWRVRAHYCYSELKFMRRCELERRNSFLRSSWPRSLRAAKPSPPQFLSFEAEQVRADLLFRRNHFRVDGDGDFIADHARAVRDAKVLASDFGAGVDTDALIAPGIFYGSGRA